MITAAERETLEAYELIKWVESAKHEEAFFQLFMVAYTDVRDLLKLAKKRGVLSYKDSHAPVPRHCADHFKVILKRSELWRRILEVEASHLRHLMTDSLTGMMARFLTDKYYHQIGFKNTERRP